MFRRINDKVNERNCVSMNSIFSKKTKEESTTYDTMSSLSHTKWNCKYHIVFTPKYRRGQLKIKNSIQKHMQNLWIKILPRIT